MKLKIVALNNDNVIADLIDEKLKESRFDLSRVDLLATILSSPAEYIPDFRKRLIVDGLNEQLLQLVLASPFMSSDADEAINKGSKDMSLDLRQRNIPRVPHSIIGSEGTQVQRLLEHAKLNLTKIDELALVISSEVIPKTNMAILVFSLGSDLAASILSSRFMRNGTAVDILMEMDKDAMMDILCSKNIPKDKLLDIYDGLLLVVGDISILKNEVAERRGDGPQDEVDKI